jgi:putative spermidine/putrescine transport system permease protein
LRTVDPRAALLVLPAALFLLLWFALPLVRLFVLAFAGEEGSLQSFEILLASPVYRQVMLYTLVVAVIVTAITMLMAWPVAYVLTKVSGLAFALALYGVLFPFWISVLVRTFSWMLLLERNGPINRFILSLGVADQPIPLLFNHTGVVIGMVHVLLPYAVIPLYASMSRIDSRLLLASDGLGAGLADTFLRVYLPLCVPGIAGGATFVFLLSLGFFITPALLGGANAMTLSMLISSFVTDRLAWSLAAAGSLVLLALVLVILAMLARLLPPVGQMYAK